MTVIAKRLEREHPKENKNCGLAAVPLQETMEGGSRPQLLILFGAVGLVLLIACANVANLLLARDVSRRREIVIRAAIGASRRRLLRQLLTESLLLASLGGAAGLCLGVAAGKLLSRMLPENLFRLDEAGLDLRVLLFTLIISILSGLLFGFAPALHVSKVRINDALKEAGRTVAASRGAARFRDALIVFQMGLSLVLLAGAGLMINSLWHLYKIRLCFDPENVLTFRCILPKIPRYVTQAGFQPVMPGSSSRVRYWMLNTEAMQVMDQLVEGLEKQPGIQSAAGSVCGLPLARTLGTRFKITGRPEPPADQSREMSATKFAVTPEYFRTMGIRVLQGRSFTARDVLPAPRVAVISETLARTSWPAADPLGQRISFDGMATDYEIVGIIDDVRLWPKEDPPPQIYVPQAQFRDASYADVLMSLRLEMWFVVRSGLKTGAVAAAVRRAVHKVDDGLPIEKMRPMEEVISSAFGPWRTTMILFGLFAGLAVLLSAIGIYGVISYAMTQRRHEIGIRMALGAGRTAVLSMVIGRGLMLAACGIVIGGTASFWLTRLIANQLFEVKPADPLTFGSVALILLGVAASACYVPARRASQLDAAAALRCD
jgi:predicted permease